MTQLKKEELQNLYCFIHHKKDITFCVPNIYRPYEFNQIMQKIYKKPSLIYDHKDYNIALKMFQQKKIKHIESINTLTDRDYSFNELKTLKRY